LLSVFKYRLYPNVGQEMRLKRSLFQSCFLYDKLRATKIQLYRKSHVSLSQTELGALVLQWRKNSSELHAVHSQAAQNVADRVHIAFVNYFEGRARFPKNRQPRSYLSMTIARQAQAPVFRHGVSELKHEPNTE
jgi:putative transposase